MNKTTGVIAGLLLGISTAYAGENYPQPISSTCQPEGKYERCTTEYDDGSTSIFWKTENSVTGCTTVYWTHPDTEPAEANIVKLCRISD